jgi:hypothetical protein
MPDIQQFEQYLLTSRGLLARPILPNNKPALRADILSIAATVRDITANTEIATGALDPAVVMYTTLQKPWKKDDTGFSFLWVFPPEYVPVAGHSVRFKIVFTIINPHADPQLSGKPFMIVFQADVKDPFALD